MKNVKLIPMQEIEKVLDMRRTIQLCEKIYTACGNGHVIMPAKLAMPYGAHGQWPGYDGNLTCLPAFIQYAPDDEILGMKWIWAFYNNKRDFNLPFIGAFIILNHPRNGEALAIMEGAYITDIRTGGATAVAAKSLVNKSPRKKIGIFGAGMQGQMHARAMCAAFDVESICIYDPYRTACESFKEHMTQELNVPVVISNTKEENCCDKDIVITASIANEPLVELSWLKKGATVFSIGSYAELADDVVTKTKLYVDSWEQLSRKGKGDIGPRVESGVITKDALTAEISDVVAGKKPGRENEEEIICACMIGMGILDVGIAGDLYKNDFANYNEHLMSFR